MANTLLTSSVIAKEMLRILENNLIFTKGVSRKYEKEWSDADRKLGDTITVRKRSKFTVRDGAVVQNQDLKEIPVPVTIDQQKGIDVSFTSKDLALDLESFSKQFIQPAMATLANAIDFEGLKLYAKVPNAVGTPGTLPSALKTYLQAGAKMANEGCPQDDAKGVLVNALTQVEIVDSLKGLFQSSTEIENQYKKGAMGVAAGFDWGMTQNIPVHQVGPQGGTPLVNGAVASGATSIPSDGWTAAAALRLKKGDIITFDGVQAVNPMNKQSTGELRQFVVTADVSSNASGVASIPVYPALVSTGAEQNVSALPADNAPITVMGAANTFTAANIAYHEDAFTLVTCDLPLPKGMDMAERVSSKKLGLSLRLVRGYDITNDKFISRVDVLFGWAAVYPELACRIQA